MGEFLLWSLIASVVLTLAVNLLFLIFPRIASRTERRVAESLDLYPDEGGGMRIRMPIKAMLVGSIALTVLINLGAVFA